MQSVMSRFADEGIVLKNIGLSVWTHQRISPISHELIKARCHRRARRSLAHRRSLIFPASLPYPCAPRPLRLPWSCFSTAQTIRSYLSRARGPTRSAAGPCLTLTWLGCNRA
jgi:hypothetical protein